MPVAGPVRLRVRAFQAARVVVVLRRQFRDNDRVKRSRVIGRFVVRFARAGVRWVNVPLNAGAHGNQHLCEVWNLGLLGGVFKHRLALGQAGGHQKVFGAGDGHHVGGNTRTMQTGTAVFQTRQHVAVLDINHRAHGLQAFDVLVHRACANSATAWQRDLGMAKASQQGAQCQHRRTHGFDQLVGCFGVVQSTGVEHHVTRLVALGAHAHVANQLDHGGDILQAGHIGKRQRVGG